MPGWRKSTSCTAVTTVFWCTSKRSSIIWWGGGAICSISATTCCSTTFGDISKTISLFGEGNAGLAGLAGDVLVAVQDHLGREGRMPADFNGEMTPFGVQDMKRVVVDIRVGVFRSMWCFALTSQTGAGARPTKTR